MVKDYYLPEKVLMYTVLKQATIKTFLKMSCVGLIKIHVMSVFYQVLLVEWPGVFDEVFQQSVRSRLNE